VDAGRLDADHQGGGDLAVGVAAGDQAQDLGLARGQAQQLAEASSVTSRVLPMPASPATRTVPPRPAAACRSRPSTGRGLPGTGRGGVAAADRAPLSGPGGGIRLAARPRPVRGRAGAGDHAGRVPSDQRPGRHRPRPAGPGPGGRGARRTPPGRRPVRARDAGLLARRRQGCLLAARAEPAPGPPPRRPHHHRPGPVRAGQGRPARGPGLGPGAVRGGAGRGRRHRRPAGPRQRPARPGRGRADAGRPARARELTTARIEAARELGDEAAVGSESANLGMVERQLGDLASADRLEAWSAGRRMPSAQVVRYARNPLPVGAEVAF
jgi:hypothetical protein